MAKKIKTCTECGKSGGVMERHDDAADLEHWFHRECWLDFLWWLAGHDGRRRPRKTVRASI